eukprot:TRINITY_DN3149_c1_g1_i2.p1 TRINITY_DN3149_c1_g1~~TRINITY_DN3149_c1_g1_i2.p1  ORF type:complete len:157 (-),score=50.52 TRINITY_DN3149_c1_g1_i2:24-494(-)
MDIRFQSENDENLQVLQRNYKRADHLFQICLGFSFIFSLILLICGSFAGVGELSIPDLLLTFFGYYAYSLVRINALKTYYRLVAISIGVDTLATFGAIFSTLNIYQGLYNHGVLIFILCTSTFFFKCFSKIGCAFLASHLLKMWTIALQPIEKTSI